MNSNIHSTSEENVFKIDYKDIILREYIIDDIDEFHSLTWQPEIYEFLPGCNVSKEQLGIPLSNIEEGSDTS
ncbi:hypothetical protein UB51_13515 [Paenibacillus sp. IHBB 10380]|nr:hypothetical protein UB51_13515 [Paenibacillus sp. IHBB 10380]